MYQIVFYTTARGESPIDAFLDEIPKKARAKVEAHIDMLKEQGPDLHRPYSDHVRGAIRELRVAFGGGQHRILYAFFMKARIVLLNAFTKKTWAIPAVEIRTAEERLKEWVGRHPKGQEVET